MKDKTKDVVNIIVFLIVIVGLAVTGLLLPDKDYSTNERRGLATLPQMDIKKFMTYGNSLSFTDEFEKYTEDQFPFREQFRAINSASSLYLLGKSENNDICYKDGHIVSLSYSMDMESINYSLDRIGYINDTYLSDSDVYFAIIPEKNYYMSAKVDVLTYDYDEFINIFKERTGEYATFIDLRDHLSLRNYYYTDSHWRQETLMELTDYMLYEMTGNDWAHSTHNTILCENLFTDSFAGVYYGQLALPVGKDNLIYMDGHYVNNLVAYCYDSGTAEEINIYDMKRGEGKDPYELFLTGSRALITVENPEIKGQELIIFRDSYGSSIAPLLAAGYSKVTLIDIRYINPAMLGKFVDFEGKDVLFLYSTQVLNNSIGQFK